MQAPRLRNPNVARQLAEELRRLEEGNNQENDQNGNDTEEEEEEQQARVVPARTWADELIADMVRLMVQPQEVVPNFATREEQIQFEERLTQFVQDVSLRWPVLFSVISSSQS